MNRDEFLERLVSTEFPYTDSFEKEEKYVVKESGWSYEYDHTEYKTGRSPWDLYTLDLYLAIKEEMKEWGVDSQVYIHLWGPLYFSFDMEDLPEEAEWFEDILEWLESEYAEVEYRTINYYLDEFDLVYHTLDAIKNHCDWSHSLDESRYRWLAYEVLRYSNDPNYITDAIRELDIICPVIDQLVPLYNTEVLDDGTLVSSYAANMEDYITGEKLRDVWEGDIALIKVPILFEWNYYSKYSGRMTQRILLDYEYRLWQDGQFLPYKAQMFVDKEYITPHLPLYPTYESGGFNSLFSLIGGVLLWRFFFDDGRFVEQQII